MSRGFERLSNKSEDIILPTRGSKHSAGYDIYLQEDVTIKKGSSAAIRLGIKAYMQPDEVLLLVVRSSMGIKNGITLANQMGVIDSDYYNNEDNEGELMAKLLYNGEAPEIALQKGTRVIQGIFIKYLEADNISSGEERKGGIGSTN